jgi:hypothetical protein
MSGFGGMMVASYKPTTVSSVIYANMVFNLDAAGYGALPGNVITTSASFDGSTQNLSVPNSAALNPGTGDFTIEFWVNLNSTTNNASFYRGNNGGVDVFMNGTGKLAIGQAQVSTLITDSVTMTTAAWVHVAVVRSSGTTTLYKNGTSVGSAGDANNYVTDSANYVGSNPGGPYRINGYMNNLRVVIGTAVYTTAFTPPTATLLPVSGTQLLLPLVATPFTDISINESTVTNVGTVITTANSAPTLTAVTTDLTGTYTMTRTGASISWKSTGTGGYFEKNNATGTDHITGGPNYATSQNYTVFMAYQGDSRSGGRLLNTANEGISDWVAGTYAGGTLYKNVFYPGTTVNLNSDSYVGNSGWNFLWALYNTTTGWGNLYIAASGVNANVGPTAVYKSALVGSGSGHGFNQFRLWSRSVGAEVQSGNIGLVRVYDNVMPLAQIQSTWANLHSRFGI